MIHQLPEEIVLKLKSSISESRYQHSIGVFKTCCQLADCWEDHFIDPKLLTWAALFHDCAKEIPKTELKKIIETEEIPYGKELLDSPKLSHAPLGAKILQDEYGMNDPEVLMAVAYHPTGHPDLTPIGWAVYIADYLEPGRNFIEERERIFEQACNDPLTGLRKITDLKMYMVKKKGKTIHPLAVKFKKYLENINVLCENQA